MWNKFPPYIRLLPNVGYGLMYMIMAYIFLNQNFVFGVVHKGRPQKTTLFPTPYSQMSAFDQPPSPLRTSAFSIHCSMVRQCNSWCSQSTLLIDLIIGAFYPPIYI